MASSSSRNAATKTERAGPIGRAIERAAASREPIVSAAAAHIDAPGGLHHATADAHARRLCAAHDGRSNGTGGAGAGDERAAGAADLDPDTLRVWYWVNLRPATPRAACAYAVRTAESLAACVQAAAGTLDAALRRGAEALGRGGDDLQTVSWGDDERERVVGALNGAKQRLMVLLESVIDLERTALQSRRLERRLEPVRIYLSPGGVDVCGGGSGEGDGGVG